MKTKFNALKITSPSQVLRKKLLLRYCGEETTKGQEK